MTLGLHNISYPARVVLADCQHRPELAGKGRRVERVCESDACGCIFYPRLSNVKRGRGRFCSRSCASHIRGQIANLRHPQAGAGNHNFKGWASRNKRAYVNRFRAANPEKASAHDAVHYALRTGKLARPDVCERCACRPTEPLHAHHDDYSRPLAVVFVCRPCHRVLDAQRQQARCAS